MDEIKLPVIEIFDSIDGEGVFSGMLSSFVRLAGCNLRCSYCDTAYSFCIKDAKSLSLKDILDSVKSIGFKHVTITGGEPLIHRHTIDLVRLLSNAGFYVNVETNGTLDVSDYVNHDKCTVTMDIKTPSSGHPGASLISNVSVLKPKDALKIVMSKKDECFVEDILSSIIPKCPVYLSPVYSEYDLKDMVNFMKRLSKKTDLEWLKDKCRMQVQLHKTIWGPDVRGV